MKFLLIISMIMISLNNFGQNTRKKISKPIANHTVKIVKFTDLETIIKKNGDKLLVINFWATWCKPCVEELPEFMEVNKMYRNNPGFKMILVSMDIATELESKVQPFVMKNKIDTEVYLLNDNKRMNEWIPAIDKSWSGAIPATVFYRNGKKLEFIENKINKNELIQTISKYL